MQTHHLYLQSALARASAAVVAQLSEALEWPSFTWNEGPFEQTISLQGRLDGTGPVFRFGEALMCFGTIQDAAGRFGRGWLLGSDVEHLAWIARWDARMRDPEERTRLGPWIFAQLNRERAKLEKQRKAQASTTRVRFANLETMRE